VALDDLRSVGILGGTFNPPHLGHIALARSAREQLGLERVLLMPASSAPNKPADPDPGPALRLRMCQLAVGETEKLSACALEVERGGASYTVDTLQAIHERSPRTELTLILGADTARTLADWREPERLLELARLAVAERQGCGREEVVRALSALRGTVPGRAPGEGPVAGERLPAGERLLFLAMGRIEISSSMVRRRVASGERVDELVGSAVASYITEHGLYREPVQAAP